MDIDDAVSVSVRWARFRFAVIGPLLASVAEHGQLAEQLEQLAGRTWQHPSTGEPVHFSVPTIERWYYRAKCSPSDPVGALSTKPSAKSGTHPSIPVLLGQAVRTQYQQHPKWSYQLHFDNLLALIRQSPELAPVLALAVFVSILLRLFFSRGLETKSGFASAGFCFYLLPVYMIYFSETRAAALELRRWLE